MPSSEIVSSMPVSARRATTTTREAGGENSVAFSSSSDTAWARSGAAYPTTSMSGGMPAVSMRPKSAVSDTAPRTTSSSGTAAGFGEQVVLAGEHEEAVGVAAHPRGEVVEGEERGQPVRVPLAALEVLDERELAGEQRLVPARQVHVEVADAGAHRLALELGDLDRRALDVVERLGERAELVARLHDERRDRRRLDGVVVERVDERGELAVGDVVRAVGELAQRAAHRPGDEEGEADRRAAAPRASPIA